jgi:DNA-binding CsgD family transcriptional regulator
MAGLARAVRSNGQGQPAEALEAARRVVASPRSVLQQWCWVEVVEAATGAGRGEVAVEAVHALLPAMQPAPGWDSDWGAGVLARAVALTSSGETAEAAFQRAVEHLRRAPVRAELARTRLLYGEWLRQVDRRRDARLELAAACELFTGMGCEGFAERARRGLAAAGAPARVRRATAPGELTAQEEQIALLARDGLSNPEIGATLFLSNRTVEWHLRKVFAKLGISSRRELRRVLSQPA